MSAVLSAESGDVDTIGIMVKECKRMGIVVLPPSVNESYSQFTVVSDPPNPYKIRFGLVTIKNFGQGVATSIIDERKRGGRFKSLVDFLDRVKDKNLNKKSLESLIKAGALDEFGERGELLYNIETLLSYHKETNSKASNQSSLFGMLGDNSTLPPLRLAKADPINEREKLSFEKELLGLYISGHPLEEHREKLEKAKTNSKNIKDAPENAECVLGGIITDLRTTVTKAQEMMAFAKLEDLNGSIDMVVFPKVYAEYKQYLEGEQCIAVKGRVGRKNDEVSFIVEKIKSL